MNFWQPNTVRPITLPQGAPWLFKLHVRNGGWVVGGGFFAHYTTITPRFAWEAFHGALGEVRVTSRRMSLRVQSANPGP